MANLAVALEELNTFPLEEAEEAVALEAAEAIHLLDPNHQLSYPLDSMNPALPPWPLEIVLAAVLLVGAVVEELLPLDHSPQQALPHAQPLSLCAPCPPLAELHNYVLTHPSVQPRLRLASLMPLQL